MSALVHVPRLIRVDFGPVIRFAGELKRRDDNDPVVLPTPEHAPAFVTKEGYLWVDGLLARDGLLEYSDGTSTWTEYRPRRELELAQRTWHLTPVTDDHPPTMVDSTNWAEFSRGVVVDPYTHTLEVDGVTYLRGQLLIKHQDLVQIVMAGDKHEVSIGMTAKVMPTVDGFAEDGTPCAAVQRALDGNHVAVVDRGRAGPAVRIFMDGAAVPVSVRSSISNRRRTMQLPFLNRPAQAAAPAPAKPAAPAARRDEVGAPTETVAVMGPDGQEYQLPAWAAAIIAQSEQEKQQAAAMQQGPAMPAAPAPAPAPAPAAAPADAKSVPADKPEESKDAAAQSVNRRTLLAYMAAQDKIPVATLVADDATLSRAVLAKRMPWVRTDAMDQTQLDTLVLAASSMPIADAQAQAPAPTNDAAPAPAPTPNIWEQPSPAPISSTPQGRVDAVDAIQQKYLERRGYRRAIVR